MLCLNVMPFLLRRFFFPFFFFFLWHLTVSVATPLEMHNCIWRVQRYVWMSLAHTARGEQECHQQSTKERQSKWKKKKKNVRETCQLQQLFQLKLTKLGYLEGWDITQTYALTNTSVNIRFTLCFLYEKRGYVWWNEKVLIRMYGWVGGLCGCEAPHMTMTAYNTCHCQDTDLLLPGGCFYWNCSRQRADSTVVPCNLTKNYPFYTGVTVPKTQTPLWGAPVSRLPLFMLWGDSLAPKMVPATEEVPSRFLGTPWFKSNFRIVTYLID